MKLRATQERFWSLVTAPEGVPEQPWIASAVRGDARASAHERLSVYANMYFFRLLENLSLDFPTLYAVLGDRVFHNLITDYLAACPSSDASVRNVGSGLPLYLRDHALQLEHPWLSDLAALDWTRLDVSDREDDGVLLTSDLAEAVLEGFSQLFLRFIGAHRTLHIDYAIEPIWRDVQHAQHVLAEPHTLLVWRQPDCSVHHRALDADECALLPALQEGLSFHALCAVLGQALPAEAAAHRALSLVSSWLGAALLAKR